MEMEVEELKILATSRTCVDNEKDGGGGASAT